MITLIGLGPAEADGISAAAQAALRASKSLYLRTAVHPAVSFLTEAGLTFQSFDEKYESLPSFEQLYEEIAVSLVEAAKAGDLSYAVPGHPLVGEESVRIVCELARRTGIGVRVVGSPSFIEPTIEALGFHLSDGLTILDALALPQIPARADVPLLLYQVYSRQIASDVKIELMKVYPDDWEVTLVRHADGIAESRTTPLHRMDRGTIDHLTSVFVPMLPPELRKKSLDDLVQVMARLRGPGGCPWDKEQDHSTLKRYLIEETYEAIEAIDNDDMESLCDELGDVLLQVVFHAQIETELGLFTIEDVIGRIVEKLIRRHPHVFGDIEVADTEEVLRNWEKIKRAEKPEGWRESALDGIPSGLPALMRAMEVSKRAVKVGFEWERFEDVIAKVDEEFAELKEALGGSNPTRVADEFGDLLFALVNVARWKKIDAEDALGTMLRRFTRRFKHIEQQAAQQGRSLTDMSLAEMDALWDEAKALERQEEAARGVH